MYKMPKKDLYKIYEPKYFIIPKKSNGHYEFKKTTKIIVFFFYFFIIIPLKSVDNVSYSFFCFITVVLYKKKNLILLIVCLTVFY